MENLLLVISRTLLGFYNAQAPVERELLTGFILQVYPTPSNFCQNFCGNYFKIFLVNAVFNCLISYTHLFEFNCCLTFHKPV